MVLAVAAAFASCSPDSGNEAERTMEEPEEIVLGPADGHELSATDLERVEVGDPAPDFTLAAIDGSPFTLSALRGAKDVVLVFYRGHW